MMYNEALKRLRENNEYSQKEMGNLLQTSQQQWSLYETGMRELKTSQIITLCKHFNVSADYILGLPDLPYPDR